jgi:hypothetical protein
MNIISFEQAQRFAESVSQDVASSPADARELLFNSGNVLDGELSPRIAAVRRMIASIQSCGNDAGELASALTIQAAHTHWRSEAAQEDPIVLSLEDDGSFFQTARQNISGDLLPISYILGTDGEAKPYEYVDKTIFKKLDRSQVETMERFINAIAREMKRLAEEGTDLGLPPVVAVGFFECYSEFDVFASPEISGVEVPIDGDYANGCIIRRADNSGDGDPRSIVGWSAYSPELYCNDAEMLIVNAVKNAEIFTSRVKATVQEVYDKITQDAVLAKIYASGLIKHNYELLQAAVTSMSQRE